MKLLVETTGSFQLHGPGPEQFARHNRPSVVRPSFFISRATAKGEAIVLGQLTDEASDEGFLAAYGDGKTSVAVVKAYVAEFALEPAVKAKPEPAAAKAK